MQARKILSGHLKIGILSLGSKFRGLIANNAVQVCSLQGYLENRFAGHGVVCEQVDLSFVTPRELAAKRFNLLGINVSWDQGSDFKEALQTIPFKQLADRFFVFGSFLNALEKGRSFIAEALQPVLPTAHIIYGEAEPAAMGLVEHYLGLRPLEKVPNIFRPEEPESQLPENTDLSHIWHQSYQFLDQTRTSDWYTYFVETSRNCDHGQCAFCVDHKMFGRGWRSYPIANVVSVFRDLNQWRLPSVYIFDKNFWGNDLERAGHLAQALIRMGNKVNFTAALRADAIVKGEDLIEPFKQAGLRSVFLGAESFVDPILERFRKASSAAVNLRAIRILEKHQLDFVLGSVIDPLASLEEFLLNLQVMKQEQVGQYLMRSFNPMSLRSGAPYEEILRAQGLLGVADDNLVYQYEFRDKRMGQAMAMAEEWFREVPHINFLLVVAMRMMALDEPQSVEEYQKFQKYFHQFNVVDIDFLFSLVQLVLAGKDSEIGQLKIKAAGLYEQIKRNLEKELNPNNSVSQSMLKVLRR